MQPHRPRCLEWIGAVDILTCHENSLNGQDLHRMTHDRSIRQRQPACLGNHKDVEWTLMLFDHFSSTKVTKTNCLYLVHLVCTVWFLHPKSQLNHSHNCEGTMAMLVDLLELEQLVQVRSGFNMFSCQC